MRIDGAVATKCRQHVLMAKVFAPRLELLWGVAQPLAELHQRVPERMRIKIGQPRVGEGLPKDLSDRLGIRPEAGLKPINRKAEILVLGNSGAGEHGVVVAVKESSAKLQHPLDD